MHISRSGIKTVELVWCSVSTVTVRMTFIGMYKLWNMNCVIFVIPHMSKMLLNLHFKLVPHNVKVKVHANNLKF